jgi:predicted DNA-binding transcriptional regulator AlpA
MASMSTALSSSEPDRLVLPAAGVAKLLEISERHLWACHASGKLGPRPIALGRSKRWRIAELHAWLAAGAPNREQWDELQKVDHGTGLGEVRG